MTFKVDDPAKRQAFQEAIATFVNNDSQAEENKVGTRRSKDKKDRHKILQEAMVKIFENQQCVAQDCTHNKLYICDKKKNVSTLIDEDPSVTISDKENEDSYEPSPLKGQKQKDKSEAKKSYYIKKKDRSSVSPKMAKKQEQVSGKLRKRSEKTRDKEESEEQHKPSNQNGMYFWNNHLHQEFMRHFSVFGKTWKVVSQRMAENGIKNKDQLQCRTHGQKYLLGLEEIKKTIEQDGKEVSTNFDKKIYQKLQRYEDDKRYLYSMFLQDEQKTAKKINLNFQNEESRKRFLMTVPEYIVDETQGNGSKPPTPTSSKSNIGNEQFLQKLNQIGESITHELDLYEYLKDLKKEKNQNKRMPMKRQNQINNANAEDHQEDE